MSISAMPKYESYRSTSIVWISELPQSWRVEKGKWLFVRAERPVQSNDEIVTCFRDGTVTLRKNRRTEGFTNALKEHGYQGIRKGDLVIHAMDAFAGAIGVSDSDGKSTPVYAACIPRQENEVNPEFYAYFLRDMALSGFITSLAKGIRERSTDFRFNDFADLELPVPSLCEQDRIAKFLDQKNTQIDEAIAIKEQQIALLKERKQIIIQRAVTQGLDPNVPMNDSGVDWIGEIPAHWEVRPLKSILNFISYGFTNPMPTEDEGPYMLTSNDIGDGFIKYASARRTSHSAFKSKISGKSRPQKGDVLVTKDGTLGRTALVNREGSICISQSVALLRSNGRVVVEFLEMLLRSFNYQEKMVLDAGGTTIKHIYISRLAKMKIALPSLREQSDILDELNCQIEAIDGSCDLVSQQTEKLKEYKTTLINSAVTGKIKITPEMVEA